MTTYYFLDVDVHDSDLYGEYVRLAPPTVAAAGGRFIVRGGAHTVLEGDLALHRLIVIEFADRKAFDDWYQSPAYRDMLALRERCCRSNAFVVDGTVPV